MKHRILCDFKVKINSALVMHKDAEKYKHIQLKIAKFYFIVIAMNLEKPRKSPAEPLGCTDHSLNTSDLEDWRTFHHNTGCSLISRYFLCKKGKRKRKAIPLQAWTGPEVSRRLRLPDFKTVGTFFFFFRRYNFNL